MQTRRRAFVAEDSDDNSDDDTITSGARCQPFEKSQLASKSAELAAQEKHQWLLVSIHDEGCFECHLLNRDVWKDPKIYQLIKRHCTFVQIPVDSSEGLRFRSSYSYVQSASHIAILDPFTGEQKMMWTHLNDPKIVYDVCCPHFQLVNVLIIYYHSCLNLLVCQFIQHTTLTNPNSNTDVINTTAINDCQYSSSIGSISLSGNGRTDSTSIDNRFTNSVPQTGIRRRPAEAANAEMHQQFNHFNLKRPRLQTSDNVHSSSSKLTYYIKPKNKRNLDTSALLNSPICSRTQVLSL
ncbi:unnamed protein product [Schistosoma curassoni]|uniref:UBX domain-containing protein n=1 Tax=Schistosoma curassoni TaxID=6186 RepID=A0A183KAW1_9TREM|nr:unnamed protein product [Schistosoma curassoni]